MSQNFDTTIALAAGYETAGQAFDFDGAYVTNLTITNNSGLSIQFTPDGMAWTTLIPGASASPTVPDATGFYLRKMGSSGSAPAPVRMVWRASDSASTQAGGLNLLTINNAVTLNYRKAFAKALNGSRARILLIGDSTTAGAGAGTNSAGVGEMVGARVNNYPTRMAQALTALGIPTYNEAIVGDQGVGNGSLETYPAYDPRLVLTNFATDGVNTVGRNGWASTTMGASWSFTSTMTFDRFDVIYRTHTTSGSLLANVDGGATLATISQVAADGVAKTTVSCTRGTHTINLVTASAANTTVIGVIPWDSTLGGVDIIQSAWFGGTMPGFNLSPTNAWGPTNTAILGLLAPDIAIVQLTINDATTGTTMAAYSTALAAVEANLVTVGAEVLLMSGIPSGDASSSNGTLDAIVGMVTAMAASKRHVYVDLRGRCVDYATISAAGWVAAAGVKHGNGKLYADEGYWLAQVLQSLIR